MDFSEENESSPMKKQEVGEEVQRKLARDGWFIYLQDPVPEPEWDVDSYDGREYDSDPEDSKLFYEEEAYQEYRLRKREAFESKGFVYEPLSGDYPIKNLEALVHENVTTRELMTDLANLCVKKFNEQKGKNVELVEIVRVIVLGGGTRKAYITFMARESPRSGPLVEYQAKVGTYLAHDKPPFPILCRPSPIPTIQIAD
ncbi:hypothetical protein AALP_AA8G182000 [Arabis alpina]|uniref:Cystatin domain-containing protein n=1 Tax=Arabis alpina TaxID=50452 RepID=A0A087G7T1_ARAAL|nr:hypothetical protein AALP_AA8G182000 [Arabis alpina]